MSEPAAKADRPARLVRIAGKPFWHVYQNRKRHSTGTENRAQAEIWLAEFLKGNADAKTKEVILVGTLLDRYLENRRKNETPGAERISWSHKQLKRHFAGMLPDSITEDDCLNYRQMRLRDEVKDATVRTELVALKAALNWGSKEHGGFTMPEKIKMPPKASARERWLTREEAARLLAECHTAHLKLFVLIALHTAARKAAILGLTWEQVNLSERYIDFRDEDAPETKKKKVPVPINRTLLGVLLAAKERADTPYVISFGGAPIRQIRHALDRAAERAGLDGVTPHVFRHTAVTWMMQAKVPPWVVSGFAGMSMEMIETVYGKHNLDSVREAADALG
jgi:integrase